LSYNSRGGHGYGNQQRHGSAKARFSWGKWKKPKEEINDVRPEEEKPKQPIPDTIHWQERPLPDGTTLKLITPTTLTSNSVTYVLSNDLDKQHEIAFEVSKLASTQKLKLESILPDGSKRSFKIIHSEDQLPSDIPVSFNDMVYVGNLRNQLRANGFTLITA
jgi:hypothetical protein